MPILDKPLHELREYQGISPKPDDFDAYWKRALAELDATPPDPRIETNPVIRPRTVTVSDLTFSGVGGAAIYAKLYQPHEHSAENHPAVLFFHGYSGNSGDWADFKLALASQGFTVAAMDCRGQGGRSQDVASVRGNTLRGHIIRGLEEESPDKLLYRSIFLDTVQLARVVMDLPGVDAGRVGTFGGSQGGALSIVCAALEPRIRRCVSEYPFLSDYRRVWEMDLDKRAYEELAMYFRLFDPLHRREEEVFRKLGYIDIQHLAPRIRAETLMALTLLDDVCPPSTQFAVFNKITAPKHEALYQDFGHEPLPGFNDMAFEFLMGLQE